MRWPTRCQPSRTARRRGHEFALLLRDGSQEQAIAVTVRIRATARTLGCRSFAPELTLRVSIGPATATTTPQARMLMAEADRALMRAKATGRNRVRTAGETAVPA